MKSWIVRVTTHSDMRETRTMRGPTLSTLLQATYFLGVHYHSGQWSRGYRLQCMAYRAMLRRGWFSEENASERIDRMEARLDDHRPLRDVYEAMAEQHGHTL